MADLEATKPVTADNKLTVFCEWGRKLQAEDLGGGHFRSTRLCVPDENVYAVSTGGRHYDFIDLLQDLGAMFAERIGRQPGQVELIQCRDEARREYVLYFDSPAPRAPAAKAENPLSEGALEI